MATALGGFSGILDDRLQLKDAVAFVPTDRSGFTASRLRVKILHMQHEDGTGSVSAVVQGAANAIERMIYPRYEAMWDLRGVPKATSRLLEGKVKDAEFPLDSCLPEIEHCGDRNEAQPLPIDPPVTSVGFIVTLSLAFRTLSPGMKITGVVALSDQ